MLHGGSIMLSKCDDFGKEILLANHLTLKRINYKSGKMESCMNEKKNVQEYLLMAPFSKAIRELNIMYKNPLAAKMISFLVTSVCKKYFL